ncbi:SacI homology domain-containing protein [Morchella snyderi]|nr:SacI homology domain-containing protein [Morchella snyderi]
MASLNPFRDINVTASASQYTFRSPSSPNAPALVIDRPSGDMRLVESPKAEGKRVTSIAGIMGMIRLRLDKYIIIITKALLVGRIRGHSVYKVQAVEFLPLQDRHLHDPDEDTYLSLLRTHLRTGPMYLSYSFDLTNSFQRQSMANTSLPLWQRADERFFWNRHVQSDLIDMRSSNPAVDPYILPVFFGYLNVSTATIKSTSLTFVLITRKSRHRAGTRYFTRGVDEAGNVANYNETEQIVILGDTSGGLGGYDQSSMAGKQGSQSVQVLSYVQTRGSVPIYWAEVNNIKYTPKIHLKSLELAKNSARKHFDEQIQLYGDNYMVNLVNQKGREERVKAGYENMVKMLVTSPTESREGSSKTSERFREIEPMGNSKLVDRLHYIYFDFHHECGGMKWHRVQLLIDKLGDGLHEQHYFHSVEGGATNTVRNYQKSVVRTNCMDCLDRTNVVQSILARWTLNRQMIDLGVLKKGENTADFENFEVMFRNAWADNADVVSRAYSGTGALKTDFTRTGVRTKAGALADLSNSITRYIRNNFADGPRQDAYDLFLGVYLPSTSNNISSSLLFVDRRPILIQSIPYILYAAMFLVFAAFVLPRPTGSGLISIRIFALFWLAVGLWAASFIWNHGMLYVNWPKLNVPGFAADGYNEALGKAKKDKIVGKWVERGSFSSGAGGGRERGSSISGGNIRLIHLEEGKKRIE